MINDLIQKIEQWAEDRNIIKGSKPIDQAMKLFSKFGELADNVGKGRDCRDDIGDVFVVLTIMAKQTGMSILNSVNKKDFPLDESVKVVVGRLSEQLTTLSLFSQENRLPIFALNNAISYLKLICLINRYTLEECVAIAYNDIKDRKGVMFNGVFIKESDPAYQDALDNIEADKRLATQKRVSVNIEDL